VSSLKHIRKFPRLGIAEEARVYDQNGRELGIVSEVSGSGMGLEAPSASTIESVQIGQRLRLSIVEPGSRATNVVEAVVRFRDGNKLGVEFVEVVPDKSL
jgi:PilZ domain-containing protein